MVQLVLLSAIVSLLFPVFEGVLGFDDKTVAKQRFVEVAPKREVPCEDTGPFSCEEEGCPNPIKGGVVTCDQMAHQELCVR